MGPAEVSVEEASNVVTSKPCDMSKRSTVTCPGKSGCLRRAQQAQIAARQPAHAYRIAHAHLFGPRREIVTHGPIAVAQRTG